MQTRFSDDGFDNGGCSVSCDKLVLLSRSISPVFLRLAEEKGERKGGYSRYIDLRKTPYHLPVRLYCRGIHNGIHKLQFDGSEVANVGLSQVRKIVKMIFGRSLTIRISRIDWCLDLWNASVLDVALYCRIARAQNVGFERSRTGITFYLRRSKQCKLLLYDRVARLRAARHPLAQFYSADDRMTRIEVQLVGKGVPFRRFSEIEHFADTSLLSDVSFWEIGQKRKDLTPSRALAAEGFLHKIEAFGVQATAKMYKPQLFSYLAKKFLVPAPQGKFPDIDRLMRHSIRDWIEDRIRFPRLPKRG